MDKAEHAMETRLLRENAILIEQLLRGGYFIHKTTCLQLREIETGSVFAGANLGRYGYYFTVGEGKFISLSKKISTFNKKGYQPEVRTRLYKCVFSHISDKGNTVCKNIELIDENIDVINYTSNIKLFIQRALSPARVSSIVLNEEERKAEVYLQPDQVSLAIGKNGHNIKLASMLTEYTIDVFRELDNDEEDTEDIYLDEFKDEIEEWVIDAIKSLGLETAKSVIDAPRDMLIEKADLEEDTVDEVLRILKAEFED
jgi:hypothetical protein